VANLAGFLFKAETGFLMWKKTELKIERKQQGMLVRTWQQVVKLSVKKQKERQPK
jgi:hypothetical protein